MTPPWLGRVLLRLARLGSHRDERDADLRELLDARAATGDVAQARRRYVIDAASVWLQSWFGAAGRATAGWRGLLSASGILQDLRFGARLFRRQWGVMTISVVGLALAIGIDTAVFSIAKAAFQPIGVAQPERAVVVYERLGGSGQRGFSARVDWPYGYYEQMRGRVQALSLEAWFSSGTRLSVDTADTDDRPVSVAFVSGGFFSTFGGRALIGRPLVPSDDDPAAPPAIVLSWVTWRNWFGADPSIVGRVVRIGNASATIVGVAARDFTGLRYALGAPPLWMAIGAASRVDAEIGSFGPASATSVDVVGLLSPASTTASAEAELSALVSGLPVIDQLAGPTLRARGAKVVAVYTPWTIVDHVLQTGLILGLFCSVLVLACANVANLLLASAARRQAEIGARVALGATRGRIARQLLTESLAIGIVAGVLGFVLSLWLLPLLCELVMVPPGQDVSPDWRVFCFAATCALFTGLTSGFAAARHGARGDVLASLKAGGRGPSGRPADRARGVFLGIQSGLCALLLIVSALFGRALVRDLSSDYGFDVSRYATVSAYVPKDPDGNRLRDFYLTARARLRTFPGVQHVSLVLCPPLQRMFTSAELVHYGRESGAYETRTSADFFEAMKLQVVRGRTYSDDEVQAQTRVAVISARVAAELWGSDDPVGQLLEPAHPAAGTRPPGQPDLSGTRVVGVVSDVVAHPRDPAKGTIYLPIAPADLGGDAELWIHANGDPARDVAAMRSALVGIVPNVRMSVRTVADALEQQVGQTRSAATMFGLLSSFAVALAVIGIFSVTTFVVGQRRAELSLRLALGATAGDLVRLTLRDTLRPVAVGLIVGLGGALLLGRWLASIVILGAIGPRDPIAIVFALVFLAMTATTAAFVPARRVSQIDPAGVLRQA